MGGGGGSGGRREDWECLGEEDGEGEDLGFFRILKFWRGVGPPVRIGQVTKKMPNRHRRIFLIILRQYCFRIFLKFNKK